MNFVKTDCPLNLREALISILEKELVQAGVTKGGAVLHFRDPEYHPERGGYHPVEISIDSDHRIRYITDFAYVGAGPFCELEKELDFDFSLQLFQQMGRDYPIHQGDSLFRIWQQNFCAYYHSGVYQVTVDRG